MTAERYAEPGYTARYLEAEWGDFVLKHARLPEGHDRPFRFADRNVRFYENVVRMLRENLQAMPEFALSRVADVGSASGRLVREICEVFDAVTDVRGYEPSSNLCTLARQMVLGDSLPERLPISDLPLGGLLWFEVTPELRNALECQAAIRKAQFFEESAESAHVSAGSFDIVCCLNVIDRHPDPAALVQTLLTMTRSGGLLCISSPLEWQITATAEEHWRDSVQDFLDAEHWGIVDERNVDYRFRVNSRRIVHYSSQVVLARRIS